MTHAGEPCFQQRAHRGAFAAQRSEAIAMLRAGKGPLSIGVRLGLSQPVIARMFGVSAADGIAREALLAAVARRRST